MRDEIKNAFDNGEVASIIRRAVLEKEAATSGDSISAELVLAHNGRHIDLFKIQPSSANREGGEVDFWTLQHFLSKVLVELEAAPEDILSRVKSMTAEGGNDLAAGALCRPFRDWMQQRDQAAVVLGLLDEGAIPDIVMCSLCIEAIALSDPDHALSMIKDFLSKDREAPRLIGALAIGNIEFSGRPDLVEDASEVAARILRNTPTDLLAANLFGSLFQMHDRNPILVEDLILSLLREATAEPGPETIHRLAKCLFVRAENLSDSLTEKIAQLLVEVSPENVGTLGEIDHAISNLMRNGKTDVALALFKRLIAEKGFQAEQLEGSSRAILSLDEPEISNFAVDCLLSGSIRLGDALADILMSQHGDDPLILSLPRRVGPTGPREALFLARKAVGFLFLRPITAASLLVAILENDLKNLEVSICELLFDPLLINYSGSLRDWLDAQALSGRAGAGPIREAIKTFDAYLQGLREAGEIPELHPSERQRMIELRTQQRKMEVASEKAEKSSIMSLIATRSVMLYGRKAISYFEGIDGSKRRNVMELGTFSTSVETPRHDILEPFGLDLTLRTFRVERLPQ